MLEWAIQSAWLKLGLTIMVYILMNVSRSMIVGAVMRLYLYVSCAHVYIYIHEPNQYTSMQQHSLLLPVPFLFLYIAAATNTA